MGPGEVGRNKPGTDFQPRVEDNGTATSVFKSGRSITADHAQALFRPRGLHQPVLPEFSFPEFSCLRRSVSP